MTSSPSDLAARLRQKWETDRQEIEQTGRAELRRLGESLSIAAKSAQRSIDADMAAWTERTRALLWRAWPGDPGRGHRARPPDLDAAPQDDMARRAARNQRRPVRRAAGRLAGASALDRGRAACREAVERVRALYGRARYRPLPSACLPGGAERTKAAESALSGWRPRRLVLRGERAGLPTTSIPPLYAGLGWISPHVPDPARLRRRTTNDYESVVCSVCCTNPDVSGLLFGVKATRRRKCCCRCSDEARASAR